MKKSEVGSSSSSEDHHTSFDSGYSDNEVINVQPTKGAKIHKRIWNGFTSFFVWRGLEQDQWDVHTIANMQPVHPEQGIPQAGVGRLISGDGYKMADNSSWRCLDGIWNGFFKQFNAPVFLTSMSICLFFILLFACAPNYSEAAFPRVRDSISTYCGWFYVLSIDLMIGVLIMLCCSEYGDIRLGADDSRPEYSFKSWSSMLFSAGMGIGLVFYGAAEPLYNYVSPPNTLYGDSKDVAFERAISIALFNWGIHGWATYSILGLATCYFSSRLKLPLSIRSALYPLLGSWTLRWPGHLIDIVAVIGTIFGLSTDLGLGTIQLNAGLNYLNPNIPIAFWTQLIIIIAIMFIAMGSVLSGTDKGIKWLSNLNTVLATLMWLSVFFINRPGSCDGLPEPCAAVPPNGSILKNIDGTVQNFGNYFSILLERSFRTGAYLEDEKKWMGGWTIFYMGWFLSWCPFVSCFLAEISRGRTIREYVLCTLCMPMFITILWFSVFGLFSMNAEDQWTNPEPFPGADIAGMPEESWNSLTSQPLETMLFILYNWTMEMGYITRATSNFLSIITCIVLVIFFISSSDSGCFVISVVAAGGNRNPPKWQKIFWVWVCAFVAITILINGGTAALGSLQALVIILGLPLCIILLLVTAGLVKTLQHDPFITHRPKPIYEADKDITEIFVEGLSERKRMMESRELSRSALLFPPSSTPANADRNH